MLKTSHVDRLKKHHMLLLQKHIELGREHLRTLLSKEGIEELCSLDLLNPDAEKEIEASSTELAGTLTLPFNTVLTATLGAWIGLNGFMGFFLTSKLLFQIVIGLSIVIGVAVAILNYRYTKREIQKRIEERTLQDIQLYILDYLTKERALEISEKTKELDVLLQMIQGTQSLPPGSIPPEELNNPQVFLGWLQRLEQSVEEGQGIEIANDKLYGLLTDEIKALKEKSITNQQVEIEQSPSKKEKHPILQKLIQAPLPRSPKKKSWLRTNWKGVLISVIPTLYGTFSSVFVYLNDAPKVTREVGWEKMHSFLVDPRMKVVEFTLAIAITIYFAFSFVNTNRKSFQRDQEIAAAQEAIVKKQGDLSLLDDKLHKLKEVLIAAQRLAGVFKILRKFSPSSRKPKNLS